MKNKKFRNGLIGAIALASTMLPTTALASQKQDIDSKIKTWQMSDVVNVKYISQNGEVPLILGIYLGQEPMIEDTDRNGKYDTIYLNDGTPVKFDEDPERQRNSPHYNAIQMYNDTKPEIQQDIMMHRIEQDLNNLTSDFNNWLGGDGHRIIMNKNSDTGYDLFKEAWDFE